MPLEPPTARQLQVLGLIFGSVEKRGFPPTIRELCDACDFVSTNAIADVLKALAKKGLLDRTKRASRGMRITQLGRGPLALEGGMRPTFANLVEAVAIANRQTKRDTERTLKRFFAELADAVWASGRVVVPGLGAFRVRRRKARRIADPRTVDLPGSMLQHMRLPATRIVYCRVAKSWRRLG